MLFNKVDKIKLKKVHALINEIFQKPKQEFIFGESPITTGLAIYSGAEINSVIDSLLSGRLGLANSGRTFEKKFADYTNRDKCILVNSGSSANLLALDAIKVKYNLNGGEIITPACSFPTTVNPIIQLGFTPAFVDVDESLNISPKGILRAINSKTKGLLFSHTLGNPSDMGEIMSIAKRNKLFVIEDCCDAYGSKYNGKMCGSFGISSTYSFYPAHTITLGEGGAITTNNSELFKIIRSLRDWGRDCWCDTGVSNTCGRRFGYMLDGVNYDHKYIYSTIGYNMKPLELQAAMGLEQLKKLNYFCEIRKRNFNILTKEFQKFTKYFELPKIHPKAEPVFFGFPILIKDKRIDRTELVKFLNKKKIATRYLFGGNLTCQPAYKNIDYKVYQKLEYTDKIMRYLFWIGIHPGINEEIITYVVDSFSTYLGNKR
ncbi:lipopolysaccharide biosynthesis protein RfbH [Candidatus Woesearchaeota archaeon]|nr:lipopolysaccharide biosynthesis protein RfbH [Candidatus Woesearchaeota archaeon]